MVKTSDRSADGPLAPHVAGFGDELASLGYSASAAKKQLSLAVHLDRWLADDELEPAALDDERLDAFFALRRDAGYANLLTRRAATPLVAYLRTVGATVPASPRWASDPVGIVAERFGEYLLSERGLVAGTVAFYVRVARRFLARRLDDHGTLELGQLSAADVTRFVTDHCAPLSVSGARQSVSALRSFLRFLRLEGVCSLALDQAVLSVAGWAPSLPRAVAASDVERLLASCDRRRALGRRDYAILALLARLGLRAGEVVALELDDIDWRAAEIVVRGKGRRLDRLPLPAEVGEALAGYLRRGRPASADRHVFLRHFAPHVGLAGSGAVRGVLARACGRARLDYVNPHRLRHSVATDMVNAGVALGEIGLVLRQSGAAATATYAKVAHARLADVVLPWPAVGA